MDPLTQQLEAAFPGLAATPYSVTSPQDPGYNCIAWAAEDALRWWEPDPMGLYYWPEGAAREYTLAAYCLALSSLGYQKAKAGQAGAARQCVALFASVDGLPTHAARQLDRGNWTSKLGVSVDIEHELAGLEGGDYGRVTTWMARPWPSGARTASPSAPR